MNTPRECSHYEGADGDCNCQLPLPQSNDGHNDCCQCCEKAGVLEADRDRLRAEVEEAHADCIRLQQEINMLRMEPCQLPTCVKTRAEVESWDNEYSVSAIAYGRVAKECDAWKAKAERMEQAIQVLEVSRTAPHNWKGDPQKDHYTIPQKALQNLFDSILPDGEKA